RCDAVIFAACANTFIIEYSPWPGVSRSKSATSPRSRAQGKEPAATIRPLLARRAVYGIYRGERRPFSPSIQRSRGRCRSLRRRRYASEQARTNAQSGRLENRTTWQNTVGFHHERLLNGPARNHSAVRLIKDILAVCWNCGQSTRPVIVVLLGVVWPAIMAFATFKTDITGVKPEE